MNLEPEPSLVDNPERSLVYSSPLIHERRQRILKETRKLLAEVGVEGFTIRTLCSRAGVAQRTLYNAFHSKDRIMALAIREAYEDVNSYIRYRTSASTLEGIVDRLISINSRNLRAINYTRAVTSIYFSPDAHPDIWRALRSMVDLNLNQWLGKLEKENNLQSWVNVQELAHNFANLEYATINDWAQGRISDDDYVPRLVGAFLSLAVGAIKGEELDRAVQMLKDISREGKLPSFPKPVLQPPPSDKQD